ncbi:YkoF family thiamine/hydroxymethylpyrimidine-binding protein [Agarilytica rhodophyticola]|uniref:YkoF family thiamine/hydroxymethylpyrimidine-binding protein n=1 Tax=Agarilytica rhodophyticola TaxID=1737490 RepID=UPI000B341293|nr:YkoF family thiamine/hydroxymethylpyrimidine-binding protein [Agarilytica rhodophyticola]
MILSVELTLYPFNESYLTPIKKTIEHLNSFDDIKIQTFPTATILMGEYEHVMDVLKETMAWSHQQFGRSVFVAKFLPGYEALK